MTRPPTKRSPAFQFYPSNFLGSPKVRAMNAAEIGVYWLLICLDWEADGFTIEDARELAESAGVTAQKFDRIWVKVSRSFETDSGRYFNVRLDRERKKQRAWRRKCSKAGKLSAERRAQEKAKVSSTVVEGRGNSPSLSPTPSPITTKATTSRRTASRPSWLPPIATAYEQRKGYGSFPYAKAGKLLKPLHEAGHSGEEIAARLARYIDWLDDPKYLSLAKFRETFGDYAEDEPAAFRQLAGYPDVVDEFGCFTEYGERVTRPRHLKLA